MAFNFLGTIDGIEKFEEFEEFVRIEASKIEKKMNTLRREKSRLSEILSKFKKSDQALRKEYPLSERADIDYIKNPRPDANSKFSSFDALNAADVSNLKKMVLEPIKFKRENNEFKIKKIRDKMEQIDIEIKFNLKALDTYESTINNIKTRFGLAEYEETQKVAELDPKDVDDSIPVTPRNAGRENINGKVFYLALSIKANRKIITFDTAAPTVQPNQLLSVINGKNNGTLTVSRILSSTSIEVFEDLVDENPATSKILPL
jgi:hypothetical protein